MELKIKEVDTTVNIPKTSDVHTFLWYAYFFAAGIVSLFVMFYFLWYILTFFVSIEDERKLFDAESIWLTIDEESSKKLNELYPETWYELYVVDMEESNAFAWPGGRLYFTNTLLDEIEYENEFLFILWHEISHIENRDVFIGLVSKMPLAIIVAIIQGDAGSTLWVIETWVTNIFSKYVEARADREALDFIHKKNGDVWCALTFFEKKNGMMENALEFFSDHPMTDMRLVQLWEYSKEKNYLQKSDCKKFTWQKSETENK